MTLPQPTSLVKKSTQSNPIKIRNETGLSTIPSPLQHSSYSTI